ncbi:hypothetical protein [Clostridium luticellarii]|jgi:hypothetical protein|uniref:Uncharacterized protein n=1 Tax=Clostridium luticellarii TaxID=1691940 RepID=A0A2T0B315_9CLOT|nr:hypothetical protein [Clostridium luticellarii]PRR78203.1 hypothetical protein CLLU_36700 [Clostridium luticellarii]
MKDNKSVLITPDVMEECLCESLDIIEKNIQPHKQNKKHLN